MLGFRDFRGFQIKGMLGLRDFLGDFRASRFLDFSGLGGF